MPQPADMIGRTLARTYQIARLLGGGGMGAVYAARHVRTGGMFAVKLLHRETAADAEVYRRFQDEARTISALRHPNIVQVTDFDRDDDGTPFIVMELLEGEDLYQRLCRVGKLPLDQVIDIGRQVGSALHAAHEKGIIHRDIKPQNIFLVRHELADMVVETAKVVDFGISKIRRTGGQMTRDMTILGTPQFMSPEAALGQNSQLDGRADQWSLAVIMYLALSGRLPFDGENLVGVLYMVVHEQPTPLLQLAPEVPEHVVGAIARAMSKKKDERFPRMADFVRTIIGQVPGGGSQRFTSGMQMNSAVFRVPTQIDPQAQSSSEALGAAPRADSPPPDGRGPISSPPAHLRSSVPPLPPPPLPPPPVGPQSAVTKVAVQTPAVGPQSAVTKVAVKTPAVGPQSAVTKIAPEAAPTQPNISNDMLPPTVPASRPPPELVARPPSQAAMGSSVQPATQVAVKLPKQSGDTPTNISMGSEVFPSSAQGGSAGASALRTSGIDVSTMVAISSDTPADGVEADSSQTPKDKTPLGVDAMSAAAVEVEPGAEGAPDPMDLQAVPTRVANVPYYNPLTAQTLPAMDSMNATVPLSSLRRSQPGSAVDTAYPSTLTRATGQQGGAPPLPKKPLDRLKDMNWGRQRAWALALIGVEPRSSKRLSIAAGSCALTLLLLLVFILSGPSSSTSNGIGAGKGPGTPEKSDKGSKAATQQPSEETDGPNRVKGSTPTPDGGGAAAESGGNKTPESAGLGNGSGSDDDGSGSNKGATAVGLNGGGQGPAQIKKGKNGSGGTPTKRPAGKPGGRNKLKLF